MNSVLLKQKIEASGLKQNFLASRMNLSGYGLQRKIDGMSEFKASEIVMISQLLSLQNSERDEIFFSRKVTESQHIAGVS